MNRYDILKLAREAGMFGGWTLNETMLERFAALVAAAEREACAKVADRYAEANSESDNMAWAFGHCAAAIRSRTSP